MKENSEGFIHATCCTKLAYMYTCTTLNDIREIVGASLQLKMASSQQRAACVCWEAKAKPVTGIQRKFRMTYDEISHSLTSILQTIQST
jgi:hypothetical protein